MTRDELLQDHRHVGRGEAGRAGEIDLTADAISQATQAGFQKIDVAQDSLDEDDRVIRRLRRPQCARGSIEEPDAERFLQLLRQLAHCRLREMQMLGRLGEAAEPIGESEGAKLTKLGIHGRSIVALLP